MAREKVYKEIYGPVLAKLSDTFSQEVGRFTTGRHVVVTPTAHALTPVADRGTDSSAR
ncbi:hypothetical protein ACWEQ7_00410 [Streptomyces sp. NPDC004069]